MVFLDFLAFGAALGFGMYLGVKFTKNEVPFRDVAELIRDIKSDGKKRRR